MTTNQTIDGVPRELRALLERVVGKASETPHWDALDEDRIAAAAELRALLDAPAYPNRICHIDYTAHPYICGCLKGDEEAQRRFDEHQAKATRPRGEPVYQVSDGVNGWSDVDLLRYTACCLDPEEYECRVLYAEQPAPVAVVLPERREPTQDAPYLSDADHEWNACIDEVAKINTHTVSVGLLLRIVGHPLVLPVSPDQIAAIEELSQIGKLNN